jgi:hypothetical protein
MAAGLEGDFNAILLDLLPFMMCKKVITNIKNVIT